MNYATDIPSSKVRWDEMYHLCLYFFKKGHYILKQMSYTVSSQGMSGAGKLHKF